MKKLFSLLLFCLILILSSSAFAALPIVKHGSTRPIPKADINTNSRFDSTDGVMVSNRCYIKKIVAIPTDNSGSFILYDNASAKSGTVIVDIIFSDDITYNDPYVWTAPTGCYLKANNGVYLDTTDCGVRIYYEV